MCGSYGFKASSPSSYDYEEPLPVPPPPSKRASAKVTPVVASPVPFKVVTNTRQRGPGGRFLKTAR